MKGIFKMAEQIANGISDEDKEGMQNLNLEELVSKVSGTVFSQMKDIGGLDGFGIPNEEKNTGNPKKKKKKKKRAKTVPNININVNVTLEDLYNGSNVEKIITRPNNDKPEKIKLDIQIEAGSVDGDIITFDGESGVMEGRKSGDVLVHVNEEDHAIFDRGEGLDLLMDIDISIVDAIHFERNITTIDGSQIYVTVSSLKNGMTVTAMGHGMVDKSGNRGDLHICLILKDPLDTLPEQLSAVQISVLEEIWGKVHVVNEPAFAVKLIEGDQSEKSDSEKLDSDSDNDFTELD